jgi:uncharacterized protein with HEPN domain
MSKGAHDNSDELVQDIIGWGGRIPDLIGRSSFEEFSRDYRTYLSVWKSIEVIGEAAGKLLKTGFGKDNDTLRTELRRAYDMRNKLSHGYAGVDLSILWATARTFVHELVRRVEAASRAQSDGG